MTTSIQDLGDRYVFGNDDGTMAIWKRVTVDPASGKVVGPGYIGRFTFRNNGKLACDGYVDPAVTINDPRIQGILVCGWHHYRAIPGETNIWNKGWDFGGHKAAGGDPFGVSGCDIPYTPYFDSSGNVRATFGVNFVDRYSAAVGKRVASVRYDYLVGSFDAKVWTTFTEFPDGNDLGPQPFVKEPKFAVGIGGSTYQPTTLIVFDDSNGTIASLDLPSDPRLQDPTHGTVQVPNGPRTRAAFFDGVNYLNVVARGNTNLAVGGDEKPTGYGSRNFWAGTGLGLDQFAVDANSRLRFDDSVCAPYCLQGAPDASGNPTLSRKWEIAKRGGDPRTEVMFHGWEGGSGMPDCLCAARAFKARAKWTNYWSISRDSGWVV